MSDVYVRFVYAPKDDDKPRVTRVYAPAMYRLKQHCNAIKIQTVWRNGGSQMNPSGKEHTIKMAQSDYNYIRLTEPWLFDYSSGFSKVDVVLV